MRTRRLSNHVVATATALLVNIAVGAQQAEVDPAGATANARLSLSTPDMTAVPVDEAPPLEPLPLAPGVSSPEAEPLGPPITGPQEQAEATAHRSDPGPLDARRLDARWFDSAGAGEAMRVGLALAVVLGLAFLVRALVRRAGGLVGGAGRPSGVVEVLARYPVSRGHHLVLLKLGRRVLLLHQGSGGMSTLADVSDPDEVAGLLARIDAGSRGTARRAFSAVLRRAADGVKEGWPAPTARLVRQESGATIVDLTRSRSRAAFARRSVA